MELSAELEEVLKNWALIRLGHEGVMLDRVQKNGQNVQKLADLALTGQVGDTTADDPMGVSIGNKFEFHNYSGEKPADPQETPTPSSPRPNPSVEEIVAAVVEKMAVKASTASTPAPAAQSSKPTVKKEELKDYIKRKVAEGIAAQQSRPTPGIVREPTAPLAERLRPWWPTILGALLATLGAGGVGVAVYQGSGPPAVEVPAEPPVDTDTDTTYSFEISSDKGKGFTTE